jgi:hypothetical protein
VLDTAEWLGREVRAPLQSFDLTMGGFRDVEIVIRPKPRSRKGARILVTAAA